MAARAAFDRVTSQQADVHMDAAVGQAVSEAVVTQAFKSAVQECKFCVTVANPQSEDSPLIAVSEEFETMTGFSRHEILGVNCRFLNQGVDMNPQDLVHLREASATGAPFTAILPNRKRSGELFLNLLDVRGLTVARNKKTGEDLWYLIGIQADVSELGEEQVPDDHFAELQMMSDFIRDRIITELSEYALSSEIGTSSSFDLLPTPEWRPGNRLGSRQLSAAAPVLRPASKARSKGSHGTMGLQRMLGLSAAMAIGAFGVASLFFLLRRRLRS